MGGPSHAASRNGHKRGPVAGAGDRASGAVLREGPPSNNKCTSRSNITLCNCCAGRRVAPGAAMKSRLHPMQVASVGTGLFNRNQETCGESSMSGIARASLSNGRKSASVLNPARTRGTGLRTDPGGREWHHNRNLLERLEAENRDLRNRVIQLALHIQVLRHAGSSASDRAREVSRPPPAQREPPAIRPRHRVGG
jgi:hypothetical protein